MQLLAYRTAIRGKRRSIRGGARHQLWRDANIIVIGAGVVGCSLAFHLARAGARVRVFDKGSDLCRDVGAVGRAGQDALYVRS